MKRHILITGIVVALFAALPMLSYGAGDSASKFGEIKSPDGALSLKVLELHDEHGIAFLQGRLKNVSDQELMNLDLTITAYEQGGASTSVVVNFEGLEPGQLTIFDKILQGYAPRINRIEIDYKAANGAAY